MLPTVAPGRGPGLSTTVRPNGHRANRAIRAEANPEGIVTISRKHTSAARGSQGQPQAAEDQQMMFRIRRMSSSGSHDSLPNQNTAAGRRGG